MFIIIMDNLIYINNILNIRKSLTITNCELFGWFADAHIALVTNRNKRLLT